MKKTLKSLLFILFVSLQNIVFWVCIANLMRSVMSFEDTLQVFLSQNLMHFFFYRKINALVGGWVGGLVGVSQKSMRFYISIEKSMHLDFQSFVYLLKPLTQQQA